MTKRYVWRILAGLAVFALLSLAAWAYSYSSPMTARASDEWSRGRTIGRTPVNRAVAMQPAPNGGVYMIWPSTGEGLVLVHIAIDGETLLDRVLPIGGENTRDPQLQVGHDGRLHVVWRERGDPHANIRYALLEADGNPVGESSILSAVDHWVVDPARLALDADGQVHAVWADEIGVHWAVLAPDGTMVREPTLLAPEASMPAIQFDSAGQLHLAWQERSDYNLRGIFYATIDPQSGEMSEPEEMVQVFRRIGQTVKGPALGLDQDTGYVIWDVRDRREISRQGQYASFPLGLARQSRVQDVKLVSGWSAADVYPVEGQQSPLLVALSAEIPDSLFSETQIVVTALGPVETPEYEVWGLASTTGGGKPALWAPVGVGRPEDEVVALDWTTEQVVSASNVPSMKPTLVMDDRYNLHLAWLETAGFGQYRVIYASTAEEVTENYNALNLWDILDPIFGRVFRVSVVVLAAGPMFVLWAVIPMGGLLVYHLMTGEEDLDTVRSRIALGMALAAEVTLTFVFPPIVTSAWPPLRWVIPSVTAVLAGAIATYILRRREDPESGILLTAFFTFTIIYSLLQLCAYFVI